jgi:Fe-S cluster assembly ATP-binding protein
MPILEIKNLSAEIEGKKILDGVNLKLESGKVHVLMGPNGSGKSTLANVIIGNPKYKITEGQILFNEKDITNISPHERAKLGIFLSFQYPTEIEGVTISSFLREAYNSLHENKLSLLEFQELLEKNSEKLKTPEDFSSRYLNQGFSGGEKKKSEILQLLTLNPKLAILDETDSGLDIDSLKTVAEGVSDFMSNNQEKTVLIITHYKRVLNYINADKISVMRDGKIVLEGDAAIADKLEEKGYGWITEEQKPSNL